MFDFISYVRNTGFKITILPPPSGVLISFELIDRETGYFERADITDADAKGCGNIDKYTGQVIDQMAAKIGRKKAAMYANRHKGNQMREREKFFRGE